MARLFRKAVFGLILAAFALGIAMGLGTLVPRPMFVSEAVERPVDAQEVKRRILVLSNPIHTDIALPADPDVLKTFDFVSNAGLDLDYPGVFWVVFGWGGRSFYIETPTWGDLKPGPVLNALTWDASVMHVRRSGDIPVNQDDVQVVELGAEEFASLLKDIRASFEHGAGGVPVEIAGAAYDAHDIFFPAVGGFNAFLGCNTWTARMLRGSGLRTGWWTPLPDTLTLSLDLHNAR
ncbi:TIGR02117 family protein [Roseibium sp. M-1]